MIYRERVTKVTLLAKNSTRQVSDTEVLEFYNLATSKMLTGLEVSFKYKLSELYGKGNRIPTNCIVQGLGLFTNN